MSQQSRRENSPPPPSSSFSKSVLLTNWWLVMSETEVDGKRLAVGGYLDTFENAGSVFTSAPIVKRFDAYTLEAADGLILRIQGTINKLHMQRNGFLPEVSRCFFIGFPLNWDKYADEDYENKSISTAIIPNSSQTNEGIFPTHVAGNFSLFKLLTLVPSNPDTSLNDLLRRNFTSGSVDTTLHDPSNMGYASVQDETIRKYNEMDKNDDERCDNNENHELHDGVYGENSINNLFTVNESREKQDEIAQGLQNDSMLEKRSENDKEQKNLHNQLCSQQGKNSAERDSDSVTRKMSLPPETSFESPQARVQRNADNESNLNSGVKVGLSSPILSLLHISRMRKLGDYKLNSQFRAQRIRVHSSNDDSEVLESRKDCQKEDTILLETSLKISLNGKESKRNDANTINSGALDDSCHELGRNRECCYALRSRNAKTQCKSPTSEKICNLKSMVPSKHENTISQDTICVNNSITNYFTEISEEKSSDNVKESYIISKRPKNLNSKTNKFDDKLTGKSPLNKTDTCNSSYNTRGRSKMKELTEKCKGDQTIKSGKNVECESTAITVEYNHTNVSGDVDKINSIHEDTIKEPSSDRRSDHLKKHAELQIRNEKESQNRSFHAEHATHSDKGIEELPCKLHGNQSENLREAQLAKDKARKKRKWKPIQRPSISEDLKSPLTREMVKKLNVASPDLLNLKRSRSGRRLVPSLDSWCQEKIIYDMDGTIARISGVGVLKTPTKGNKSEQLKAKKLR